MFAVVPATMPTFSLECTTNELVGGKQTIVKLLVEARKFVVKQVPPREAYSLQQQYTINSIYVIDLRDTAHNITMEDS